MVECDKPQSPSMRQILGSFLGLFCLATGFFSPFVVAQGTSMAVRWVNLDIPAGTVRLADYAKSGFRLTCDNGSPRIVPYAVKSALLHPFQAGDRIKKNEGSLEFIVNDMAVTSVSWVVRAYLISPAVFFGVHFCFSAIYVACYRRTPFSDLFPGGASRQPRRGIRGLILASVWSFAEWIGLYAAWLLLMGVVSGLLGVIKHVVG